MTRLEYVQDSAKRLRDLAFWLSSRNLAFTFSLNTVHLSIVTLLCLLTFENNVGRLEYSTGAWGAVAAA